MVDVNSVDVALGSVTLLLGWLHIRMNALGSKIEDLDKRKVDHDAYDEIKSDLKFIRNTIVEIQLEQARWKGRAEQKAEQNKQG